MRLPQFLFSYVKHKLDANMVNPVNHAHSKTFLFWFSNEHSNFREALSDFLVSFVDVELEALFKLFSLEQDILRNRRDKGPFVLMDFPDDTGPKKLMSRTVLAHSCYELWASGQSLNELHDGMKSNVHVMEPFIDDSFQIRVNTYGKTIQHPEKVRLINTFEYVPLNRKVDLKNPSLSLHLIQYFGLDSNNVPVEPYFQYFGRWVCFYSDEVGETKEQSLLDELAHSDTVRKLIECPVCLELPLPPIYVCNKGHIVCNNCQARTYACPLCREHYSTTRGFVAEGIIEKCTLRCKNADQGCPLTMKGSAMVDHLDVCDYRPVKCVDCGGKLVNFDEYEEHLLKYHRINGIHQSRAYVIYSMNLTHQIAFGEKCCWPQYYLKAFDGNVKFLLRLYATHWFVCAWISLLGPRSECAKYEALLEFHPTQDDSVVHTWQGPVNHFRDDPAKQIFLQGRGLITPMETLMEIAPVAADHAEWLYNIEILQANADKSEGEDACLEETEGNNNINAAMDSNDDTKISGACAESPQGDLKTDVESASQDSSSSPSNVLPVNPVTVQIPPIQVLRMSKAPAAYSFSETPRRTGPTYSTHRTPPTSAGAAMRSSRNCISANASTSTALTPGPATLSPSTSVLAAAATVTSALPTPNSLMESPRNAASLSSTFPSFGYGTSQNGVSVSTASPTARFFGSLRKNSPFCQYLAGTSTSRYGISEDDWNCSSESEEE